MKRLLILFAAILMASTGLWAQETQNVSYLYPVYNIDGVPTSGIKEWKTASVDATVVTDASEPVSWNAGWYVVLGNDVQTSGLSCPHGDVHLILADGAKLTTNVVGASTGPGIHVSNLASLTIYGQAAQSGQLIAKGERSNCAGIGANDRQSSSGKITINGGIIEATGCSWDDTQYGGAGIGSGGGTGSGNGSDIIINGGIVTATGVVGGAGIGGGDNDSGSNITINGGTVTANGGIGGAGIGGGDNGSGSYIIINDGIIVATGGDGSYAGAGIGGGGNAVGSNITINGGTVTSSGGKKTTSEGFAAGIGCGSSKSSATNITVTSTLDVKADNNNPPSTVIENVGYDLANKLADQRYVTINPNLATEKSYAITAINAEMTDTDNGYIKGIGAIAIASINAATSVAEVIAIKMQALSNIAAAKGAYNDGKTAGIEEGKSAALGTLGEKQNGPAVIVTDQDDKQIILYSPKKVQYVKVNDK